MAPVIPDPKKIRAFKSEAAFEAWLRTHHERGSELWIRIYKKGSGTPTVTPAQALDVALCWGWIDGLRKSLDAVSFLQRYSPRRARSPWSQINRDHVHRLTAAGRMQHAGIREVDRARTDGRWAAAAAPVSRFSEADVPGDLRSAIAKNANARRLFQTLGRRNLRAFSYLVTNMKSAAGRARKIEEVVARLARGEVFFPEPGATTSGRGKRRNRAGT